MSAIDRRARRGLKRRPRVVAGIDDVALLATITAKRDKLQAEHDEAEAALGSVTALMASPTDQQRMYRELGYLEGAHDILAELAKALEQAMVERTGHRKEAPCSTPSAATSGLAVAPATATPSSPTVG